MLQDQFQANAPDARNLVTANFMNLDSMRIQSDNGGNLQTVCKYKWRSTVSRYEFEVVAETGHKVTEVEVSNNSEKPVSILVFDGKKDLSVDPVTEVFGEAEVNERKSVTFLNGNFPDAETFKVVIQWTGTRLGTPRSTECKTQNIGGKYRVTFDSSNNCTVRSG